MHYSSLHSLLHVLLPLGRERDYVLLEKPYPQCSSQRSANAFGLTGSVPLTTETVAFTATTNLFFFGYNLYFKKIIMIIIITDNNTV